MTDPLYMDASKPEPREILERIGIIKPNDMSGSEMIEHAKIAEAKGFESVWVAEDYYFRDAIGSASALSVVTKRVIHLWISIVVLVGGVVRSAVLRMPLSCVVS